jgi:putative transposase
VTPRRSDSDLRRGCSSVYTLHAHLVFVTNYRRPVLTDPMRDVCTDLDVGLRVFNGETDHVQL